MRALDLFSGIGGFALAGESVGIETAAFCEIEPFAVGILKKRFPGVPVFSDVRELGADSIGGIDIVCGGFPCQDLSVAGKRAGLAGERSGLWYEMLRVVREVRPRWVVAENVRGAVNLALDTVCAGLEDAGYVVWPFLVPASAFGAPHRRERLFVVAAREDVAYAVSERLQRGFDETDYECEWGRDRVVSVVGSGARFWPTPRGSDGNHGGPNQRGSRGDLMLSSAVAMWPTPSVRGNYNRRGLSDTSGDGLATAVNLWPTPHRNCSNGAGAHGDGGLNIQTAVSLWPTPRANKPEGYSSNGYSPTLAQRVTGEVRPAHGMLSPDWVECLMGFPLGWTDIDCNEPEPWPGWPALMGEGQHTYEPPRTCGKLPNRAARLKCLGNAVVPAQVRPFLEGVVACDSQKQNGDLS